jgi:hypothetical protein
VRDYFDPWLEVARRHGVTRFEAQHDGVSLLLPVIGPARILDLEDLRAIAPAFPGVAGLELHLETLPGGAALVVLELDLAINAVIAVRVAAIDLPGFRHDASRVMHRQQLACWEGLKARKGLRPTNTQALKRRQKFNHG